MHCLLLLRRQWANEHPDSYFCWLPACLHNLLCVSLYATCMFLVSLVHPLSCLPVPTYVGLRQRLVMRSTTLVAAVLPYMFLSCTSVQFRP